MTNLCTKFHLKISKYNRENERKLNPESRNDGRAEWRKGVTLYAPAILWRDYSTRPKIELNLRFLVTHLYTEFQFKMSICNGDNEWKLKINGIFLSPRGITLPNIIRPNPNLNSTCVFLWHIYIRNFNSKCQFVMEIMNGNWKLMEFF